MNEPTPTSSRHGLSPVLHVPTDGLLVERIAALVAQTRATVATSVNSALTRCTGTSAA